LSDHLQGRIAVRRGNEGWELTDEEWEGLQSPSDVHERAVVAGPRLTAIARLRIGMGEPIGYTNAIIERTAQGPVKHAYVHAVITGTGRVRLAAVFVGPDGNVRPSSPPESWEGDLELAAIDPDVERALAFLAAPVNWVTSFAALDAVHGDRRIRVRAGRGWLKGYDAMAARGWAARDDLDRFDKTAQSYAAVGIAARHGRNVPPPADPMPMTEGHALVVRIITSWMRWIQAGRP
jgi:hypothetical protein